MRVIEVLEKTLIEITNDSDYTKYLRSLNDKENLEVINEDHQFDGKKEKIKINAIEILINILTIVPSIYCI